MTATIGTSTSDNPLPALQHTPEHPLPAIQPLPAPQGSRPPDDATRLLERYRRQLMLGDAVSALAAGLAALWVRFAQDTSLSYLLTMLAAAALWPALLAACGSYERRFLTTSSYETDRTLRAGLLALATVAVVSYLFDGQFSRTIVLLTIPSATLAALLLRWALRRQVRRVRKAGRALHRTLVVGRPDAAYALVRSLQSSPSQGLDPVAVCAPPVPHLTPGGQGGVPTVGGPREVLAAVDAMQVHTVAVIAHPELSGHELRRLAWALEERTVDLLVSPGIVEVAGPRISIRPVAGLSLLHLDHPTTDAGPLLVKAVFDRVLGTLLLSLASPLLLLIALTIRLDSRGPALFRQQRVGAHGRTFTMIKFRSMVRDAEARLAELSDRSDGNDLLFKMKRDPRITRVGAVLRKYSLDELPQLLNVVAGQMSLVGPRPPLPTEVAQYDNDTARRLRVKPGMTGLWQVSGRSDLSWEESLRLDLRYVDNWSIGLDLTILWRTFRAVVSGSGAY